ncbi:MAG: Mrp/NBP35 family ATP-binding protein [Thermoplasmatota archaeon]
MQQKINHEKKITENMQRITHKIIVLSGKGGVGKSTVTANMAYALSQKGYNIGILDSDFHGPSIPKIVGIEDKKPESTANGFNPVLVSPHLKVMSIGLLLQDKDSPIIWRGPLKMGIAKQFLGDVHWGTLDYLIIDLPPGTGDEPLSIAQLIPDSDGAIIVTTPQDVALVSVRKSINFVKKMNIPILGIIENMSGFICPHCKKRIDIFKAGGAINAAKEFDIPFLGQIPIEPSIVITGDKGEPFLQKHALSEAGKTYTTIINKIDKTLKERS